METSLQQNPHGVDWYSLVPESGQHRRLLRVTEGLNHETSIAAVTIPEEATHQCIMVLNGPMITHLSEVDQCISASLAKWSFWEASESLLLTATARPGMCILDVGSNIGYYAMLFARIVGSSGAVAAFEPEPRNALIARLNIIMQKALCPSAAPVQFFDLAVGESCTRAELSVYPNNLGYHSQVVREGWEAEKISVKQVSLDSLREAGKLPRRIDLIKADIQGAECAMLRGSRKLIRHDLPVLCLELEPQVAGRDLALAMIDELLSLGYAKFRVFDAIQSRPLTMLPQWACWLNATEVRRLVLHSKIGAFGTLWSEF